MSLKCAWQPPFWTATSCESINSQLSSPFSQIRSPYFHTWSTTNRLLYAGDVGLQDTARNEKKRRLAAAIAFFVRKEKENACFPPPLHISCAKRADRCCSISARIVLTSASVEGVWGGSNGLLQLSAFLNASWGVAHVRKVRVKLPQTEQKQLLFFPPRNSFFFPLSI